MGLIQMFEEALKERVATATVATQSTHMLNESLTVATVATVAVANSPKHSHEDHLPLQGGLTKPHALQKGFLHTERLRSFKAKGISDEDASNLAAALLQRDIDRDDRRSCAECMSFFADKCLIRITPIGEITVHTLHRCTEFIQISGLERGSNKKN